MSGAGRRDGRARRGGTTLSTDVGLEPQLRLRDLGPMEVERDGLCSPVAGARLESILALLLVHLDRPVGADTLCEALWGDDGAGRAASTLDSHVWRLRRLLEPGRARGHPSSVLLREPGGYRLAVREDQVDSRRFAALAREAADLLADGTPDRALRVADEALGLWRGRPFGTAADGPGTGPAVARLEDVRAQLRETHIGALLETGARDRALAELDGALADEPLHERLWAFRMRALRDGGRRPQALRAFAEARTVLADELGVEPGPELQSLHVELLRDDATVATAPASPPPATPTHTLPPVRGRLVGREREASALLGMLAAGSPVTVVGTAGAGKTRLAVEVARAAAPRHPDGAWFVDLTSADPDRVLDTVSSTLELPGAGAADPVEVVRDHLASRRLLVVLDNCEHVLDAVADLVDGLPAGGSTVLATSREPLEVDREVVLGLAPLEGPAAVELLLERLGAVTPSSGWDADALERAREIATAVDGLPLALELAAGRARAYTLAEIATQVRADASTLSRVGRGRGTGHHRALRDAIGTSYRDLDAPLAALHRGAGAVPGPFTAGLASALGATDGPGAPDVTDVVAGLVHRSLLSPLGPARPGGASRFAQLAVVRGHAQHAAERAGEDPAIRRDAWVERLVRERPGLGSPDQAGWYDRLDDDLPALRATLQHTLLDSPSAVGLAVTARLGVYWGFRGMLIEGRHWLQAALGVSASHPGLGRPGDRAVLRLMVGNVLLLQGRPEAGRAHVRAGIAEADGVDGDDAALVSAELAVVTGPLWHHDDGRLMGEVAAAARETAGGSPVLEVAARHTALAHAVATGPRPGLVEEFMALHDEARDRGNLYTAWNAATAAALLLLEAGRPVDALARARGALRASVELGQRDNGFVVGVLGTALGHSGDHRGALRVLGAAEAQYRAAGRPWPPQEHIAALVDGITADVGADVADGLRAEGAGSTLADLTDA